MWLSNVHILAHKITYTFWQILHDNSRHFFGKFNRVNSRPCAIIYVYQCFGYFYSAAIWRKKSRPENVSIYRPLIIDISRYQKYDNIFFS